MRVAVQVERFQRVVAASSRRVSGGRFHLCSMSLSTEVWS